MAIRIVLAETGVRVLEYTEARLFPFSASVIRDATLQYIEYTYIVQNISQRCLQRVANVPHALYEQ